MMLKAQRTRPDCQLCEHRVSRGGRERERGTDRRWVGVNATEQSLVILPCYSDLFVILLQMFSWSRDELPTVSIVGQLGGRMKAWWRKGTRPERICISAGEPQLLY